MHIGGVFLRGCRCSPRRAAAVNSSDSNCEPDGGALAAAADGALLALGRVAV